MRIAAWVVAAPIACLVVVARICPGAASEAGAKENSVKIALISRLFQSSPAGVGSGAAFQPSLRETPAQLLVGDDQGWWRAADLWPGVFAEAVAGAAVELIRRWPELQPTARWESPRWELPEPGAFSWLPPVVEPSKILCIGLNYADHATETGAERPTLPVVFSKFPTTLTGHEQPIYLPAISEKVDFEAELVVVIGKAGRNIPEAEALSHVFGYTCGHDVSARDWQKGRPGGQWLLGKTFDSFAPVGPWIVMADTTATPAARRIQFRLNGVVMQDSSTEHFIFSIAHLISHISQFCTLLPGDLLFSGTPSGVGVARTPPVFMQHGDRAEVEIEGLGVLANPVIKS